VAVKVLKSQDEAHRTEFVREAAILQGNPKGFPKQVIADTRMKLQHWMLETLLSVQS
jgi:hypothetical protein